MYVRDISGRDNSVAEDTSEVYLEHQRSRKLPEVATHHRDVRKMKDKA